MRAIAIGAAIFLVTVGAAAGSGPLISQKPLEAPRPAGVPQKKVGLVQQVACASVQSCAAFGLSLYTEQAGKWKAVTPPVLAHTGGTTVRSLACPAAGKCEAVARGGANHVEHLTQSGRQWRAGEFALPAKAAPVNPPAGPYPDISLACASAGNCTAVGHYYAADHITHALLITESNGTWSTSTDVPLPADASTTFPPPNESFAGGSLSIAACPSAGSCTTVGSYTRKPNSATYPWILDESAGQWGAATRLELPPGAGTTIDYRGGGGSPFMGFTGLSCPSAGNCTAVGGYVDANSDFQGGIFTERGGNWSNGIKAPVPANAGPNTDAMELNNPMTAVSCAAPAECAAVGFYVMSRSKTQHGLLLAEHQGKWKASALVLPRGTHTPGGVFLTSVSCPSRGNCVAVGYYGDHGKTHGLVVRERGGKWQRAVNAALPKDAAPATRSHTFLTSVTCPSAHLCLAGGYYPQRTGATQGLLLSLLLSLRLR